MLIDVADVGVGRNLFGLFEVDLDLVVLDVLLDLTTSCCWKTRMPPLPPSILHHEVGVGQGVLLVGRRQRGLDSFEDHFFRQVLLRRKLGDRRKEVVLVIGAFRCADCRGQS